MATNLVSLAMKFLTPDLVLKIAAALGLDKAVASKAVAAAVPVILAGLVGRSAKPDGAKSIIDAIGKLEPGLLGSLATKLGGSGKDSLVSTGTSALTSLLGSTAVGGLAGALAKFAGAGESTSKSLLGLLGPVVLGSIGQEQKAQRLDASGLASLLSAQKDHVSAALPPDFSKLLGSTGLLEGIGAGGKSTAAVTPPAPRKVDMPARGAATKPASFGTSDIPSAPWWRLPAIATAALALAWVLFGTAPPSSILQPPTTGAQKIVADGIDVGALAAGAIDTVRTALGGIRDAGTAQASLPRLQDAARQLDRVTALAAKLSPDMRKALAASIATGAAALPPLFSATLAMPGVSAVAKPAIDGLRAKLDVLSKA